jgi:hypothetical protein
MVKISQMKGKKASK